MIPYVNATLTAITAPGAGDGYDVDAPAGGQRWAGTVGIYVAEELVQIESPGRLDEVVRTRLEIPYRVGQLVRRGDTLAYELDGVVQQPRTAQNIIASRLTGRVRITLTPG